MTIHGTATLIDDQTEKNARWKPEWADFYANRADQYLLIKVIPEYMEVINYRHELSGDNTTWHPSEFH